MIVIYSLSMWTAHAVSLLILSASYCVNEKIKDLIENLIDNHQSLTAGLFTTAITAGMIEGSARIASGITWTCNIPSLALAVWLPQGIIMLNTILLVSCHAVLCCMYNEKCTRIPTSHLHIILPLHLISFGLAYFLFPAIILVLAYPTQMIATMTFVLSYLFATTIFSASLFNICKDYIDPLIYNLIQRFIKCVKSAKAQVNPAPNSNGSHITEVDATPATTSDESHTPEVEGTEGQVNQTQNSNEHKPLEEKSNVCSKICAYSGSFTLFWILMLYIHCIAILFLYSLLIGRGSAISTGPLAVISLLPSILISGIAWIVQKFTFDKPKNTTQTEKKAEKH